MAATALLALAACASFPAAVGAKGERSGAPDAYLLGYVIAVLEREFAIGAADVAVEHRVVYIRASQASADERARIRDALVALESVDQVLFDDASAGEQDDARADSAALEGDETPAPGDADGAPGEAAPAREWRRTADTSPAATETVEAGGLRFFSLVDLFEPLIADPRWPHFAASLVSHRDDPELAEVAAVSLGESIPLVSGDGWYDTRWELAIQAAVHSIFDLDSDSFDLLNSDFLAGLALTTRKGPAALLVRLIHQSSHLGDELLLREAVDRVNLSFEEVSALAALDLWKGSRVYFGSGFLVHTDPSDLDPWSLQAGLELDSPWTFADGAVVPVAAVDVQSRQETGWDIDTSARAGLELRSARFRSLRAQLLVEYYDGHSPNGQFYDRRIEYIGGGVHLFF